MAKKKTLETKNLEVVEPSIEKVVIKLGENVITLSFNPSTKECEVEVI